MDSRYSAQRDNYRLPEEGIRIDLRAERARQKGSTHDRESTAPERPSYRPRRRPSHDRLASSPSTTSPSRRSASTSAPAQQTPSQQAPTRTTPKQTTKTAPRRQASRPRTPISRRGLGVLLILAMVLVGIVAALQFNKEPDAPAPQPTDVVAEPAAVIEPSPAVEMYIPTIDVRAEFEEGSCRIKDNKINPDSMNKACTYTAEDKPYSLPGTDAQDVVVVAGHTGAGVPAVFNNLYDGSADEHKASVGDKLYLRTQNSGEQWLVYTATDLHDPSKDGLEQDESIWGTDAQPGRLLTISCIQPANPLAAAVRNAVVGWQFEGVTEAPDPAAEQS
ncbi:hypothetical protein QP999_00685 [Corynebacterium sp. MSK004]|uniref:hypothetical protein n=1 Tax=Corynebacterium TaxID=1716 RepID=UPI001D0D4887|nr:MULTISPECIES: hypothetical protein [Corynebacterium]MDK8896455.1 hypothetical protein [Corynebacterium sp. MSK004]